jgi:hypothetical protein
MDVFGLPVPGPGIQFPPNLACLAQKSQGDEGIQMDLVANLFYRFDTFNFRCTSTAGNWEIRISSIVLLALLNFNEFFADFFYRVFSLGIIIDYDTENNGYKRQRMQI